MESAAVTLVKGDLSGIVRARRLSRAVMRNIRENLFFSIIFNAAGVPTAAGLLYPWLGLLMSPIIAGHGLQLRRRDREFATPAIDRAMRIGEVSATSGFSQRLIRHYEKIGLITPASRRDSGYRDYSTKDMHKLQFIGRARDLGFSIEVIPQLLGLWEDRDRSSSDVKALALARSAELKKRELAPRDMRRFPEHLAESCAGSDRPECPILNRLEGAS